MRWGRRIGAVENGAHGGARDRILGSGKQWNSEPTQGFVDAGIQRYRVGAEIPKFVATSRAGVPLALSARILNRPCLHLTLISAQINCK